MTDDGARTPKRCLQQGYDHSRHRPITQIRFSTGVTRRERKHRDGACREEMTSEDAATVGQYKDWASDVPRCTNPSASHAPQTTHIHAARAAMSARPHPSCAICPRCTHLSPRGQPPSIQTVPALSKETALDGANSHHRRNRQRPSRLGHRLGQQPRSSRPGKG